MSGNSAAPSGATVAGTMWFGWLSVVRLGVVQACLGAIVVMTTSTLNRVMVVELGLPALLPGVLIGIHYVMQLARPRMGHGSDVGGRRTPWIVGGMAVLATGGALAAAATAWMGSDRIAGIALAIVAFVLIGIGVSACGTSLLVLLAKRVEPTRRAGAATVVWLMMIMGFAVTAGVAGRLLDPYSPLRLLAVSSAVSLLAMALTWLATLGLEGKDGKEDEAGARAPASTSAARGQPRSGTPSSAMPFREALAQVWAEPAARRFTVFIFVSMLAYSALDLILEPFAGLVFHYTPGQSTGLAGVQHAGMLVGMLAAALAGRQPRFGSLRAWQIGGCLISAIVLLLLVGAAQVGPGWPLAPTVFALGAANGAFSIAAIASMMRLACEPATAGARRHGGEGVRMGLWGAAQALAFALGGVVGTAGSDLARWLIGDPATAYATVFGLEALLFVAAAVLAAQMATAGAGTAARVRPARWRLAGYPSVKVTSR